MSTLPNAGPWISPKLLALPPLDRPSPVHPPELKSELPIARDGGILGDAPSLAETFRHSGWRHHRRLVYESLQRTQQSATRFAAFADCGSQAYIYRSLDPPYIYRLAGSSCHDKFCTPCARDRSRCIATNVLNHMKGDVARFITLTLKHSDASLLDQVRRLQKAFSRLRTAKVWKRHVVGGAAFVEIKWIPESQAWHPHFHVICQGRYFPQQALSAAWWRITGDSFITDIRFVQDEHNIARYIVKYAGKPLNNSFVNRPDRLDEAVEAFRGRRLCHTFGTWRGLQLTKSPCERDWVALGTFHDTALHALAGDPESYDAMQAVCGDRLPQVLDAVAAARPPPKIPKPLDCQLTFTWPPLDSRF